MKEMDWFMYILQTEFQVDVDREQIGYESVELALDELDANLIPFELVDNLPYFLLFQTMVVKAEDGTEWLGVIVQHPETREWCIQVVLMNGEPVLRK